MGAYISKLPNNKQNVRNNNATILGSEAKLRKAAEDLRGSTDYGSPALKKEWLSQLIEFIRNNGANEPSGQRLQRDAALGASEVKR